MPSAKPLPTIVGSISVANASLGAERLKYTDTRSGSMYNHLVGPMAVLLSREADADQDNFRAIYFDAADGEDLTALIQGRYGVEREQDTYGTGIAILSRTSTSGGGGTIWAGTRIQIGSTASVYTVETDTPVAANALSAPVPIQSTVTGPAGQISINGGSLPILDGLYDSTWTCTSIQCGPGDVFEQADAYRARTKTELLNRRNGYLPELQQVCRDVGASFVVAFPSYYGLDSSDFDDDFGINAIYVADQNYQSSGALTDACRVALESARVLGADLLVGGITQTALSIGVLITLVDDPGKLDLVPITRAATTALLGYFGSSASGYLYKRVQMASAIQASHPAIQTASIPAVWTQSATYGTGSVTFPSPSVGYFFQATTSGTSGISQPAFIPVPGATTKDGSVVWTCIATQGLGVYQAGTLQTQDPTLAASSWTANLARYTLAPNAITLAFTGPI